MAPEARAANMPAPARTVRGDTRAAVADAKRAVERNVRSAEARRQLGAALLEDGDPVAAEVELRKALELGAAEARVLPDLARAMLVTGQAPRVVSEFAGVRLGDPAQAELQTWVAAAFAQRNQRDHAEETLAAALRARPGFAPALLVQARLKAAAGDVDGALQLLDSVLAADPDDAHAGNARAQLLWLGRRDGAGALAAARRVLEANPSDVAALSQVAAILFAQGDTAGARQQYLALKKAAPNHPETLFYAAQFAYVDRDYRGSRELTDLLFKLAPEHLRALELAGAAEYQLGNDNQAQAFLSRALALMPSLVLARRILAHSFMRSGRPAGALEALAPLVEGEQADAESLTLAGSAYLELGDAKRAEAAFARAAKLAPDSARVRTDVALAMVGAGRPELAVRELERLAATDTGPRAELALVSARIAQGDMKAALKAIDALEKKMPGQPLPAQLRGQVQVSLRDADGARRSFSAALDKEPKYFPAVAALASMDVATGKPDEARRRVTNFLRTSPNHVQALMLLADIPTSAGLPARDAVQSLAQAVRANPRDARTHLALVGRHVRLGDPRAALAAAQAGAAALPNDTDIITALGRMQVLNGDTREGVANLRKVATLLPASAQAQMNLAEGLLAARDVSGAKTALQKAIELEPRLGEARRALAMLALREQRSDEALAIAREMQKLEPRGALGWAVQGDIEAQRRNWPPAADAYRKALELSHASEAAIKLHTVLLADGQAAEAERVAADWERQRPGDPAFRFHLGDLAVRKQDYAGAEAHYRKVLEGQPANALAMNNLAWVLHQQGKPGALQMAERANATMPNRAPILDTLATIQAAAGRLPQAIDSQRQAVTASPQDHRMQFRLAQYLARAGKRDEARDLLDDLVRLGDGFAQQDEVRKLRARL